ncbi:eosinophil peroxidase-like [Clytia hemisphaerica]|uniref:Uncharacterized protein n=1 Tax=Clytia hemisphaerica TaxID=252671 RepID=A0A7M5X1S3_9CNID
MERIIFLLLAFVAMTIAMEPKTYDGDDTYVNCIKENQGPDFCSTYRHGTEGRTMGVYRTIDGTCNNLKKPKYGATNTKLRRIIPAKYDDGVDLPRGHHQASDYEKLPTAHQVSHSVFKAVNSQVKNDKNVSVLFMTFGQFLDHDLSVSPHEECNVTDCSQDNTKKYPCMPIKFDKHKPDCFGFARSKPACKSDEKEHRIQLNELTAFLDLSQVYGSDDATATKVRKNDGSGELKVDHAGLLPIDRVASKKPGCRNPAGCPIVGDKRGDENIALHSMHTLWVRQHNYLARGLKKINSHWDEVKLYEEARKINGALWQHITYNEFLPKLYDVPGFSARFRGRKRFRRTRYNPHVDPSIINGFSTAAFRFGHSLVPNSFSQMGPDFNKYGPSIKLQNAFFNSTVLYKDGIEPTMMGLCANMSDNINNGIAEGLNKKLFVFPGSQLHNDLMSLNIQRGRDHGIPPYMNYRRACGFGRFDRQGFSFDDLLYTPKDIRQSFKNVYKSVEDIDLFVGGLTENHLREKLVGPTFSCIFKEQFEALRFGDRFFYTHRGRFSLSQLREITKITMSRVLCNNLKSMVSMQRDAFRVFNLSNDERVTCGQIRDVDLEPWRERKSRRPRRVRNIRPAHIFQ